MSPVHVPVGNELTEPGQRIPVITSAQGQFDPVLKQGGLVV